MTETAVIIPNYNGEQYLRECLDALAGQTSKDFSVLIVDNGSTDGSLSLLQNEYPQVSVLALPENTGFCHAINEGTRQTEAPFVVYLNNDTVVFPDFIEELTAAIKRHPKAFAVGAKMLQYRDHEKIDSAGVLYSAMGWAYDRGKDRDASLYEKEEEVFAVCAGAAIYRRKYLLRTGLLDEAHFAYLEDLDLCYRARIMGFENWYAPMAKVYHVGSAASGSRHNPWKVKLSAQNNVYVIHKNMTKGQKIINAPFLGAGFLIKSLFFTGKGLGRDYREGLKAGAELPKLPENKKKIVPVKKKNQANYRKIEKELLKNMFLRR